MKNNMCFQEETARRTHNPYGVMTREELMPKSVDCA